MTLSLWPKATKEAVMRSDVVKNRRALFLSMGRTREEIARPLVGIVNS